MTLQELRSQYAPRIRDIGARYGAVELRVFGSVARGSAAADSDVDFLVQFEPGRSLLDQGGLLMDLNELLPCSVDVVTAGALRDRMRARVLAEAVPL